MIKRRRRIFEKYFLPEDPLWYRDAVLYELHVRAFADSNDDGIGDFRGLAQKLGYLEDLGVTAIWLLPFYPSPLKDDGYDISDYTDVHPDYGTLSDFRAFVREAHARGIRVITELVINHTSDQHPWFQRARRAKPGSPWRDFYVWSKTREKYRESRIIFQDFESSNWTWDPMAGEYYWHRFYSHQPDLNFDNPRVQKAVFQIMDFWLEMGVDGLRLDAVPYLVEREGTNCENLPETHGILRDIRQHVDRRFKNRMLLAEANQWPEDAIAYFGNGDECHMAFHFPLMPRLFMALRMEDRFPIIDILEQTPPIPDACQWALFLRNHDELTLEMVTDEDRDYMYRVYAEDPRMRINLGIRRRLAPLLHRQRRKIELMTGLLFSLPGTPVIYYGDEIGMGDNIYLGDRNSVRTPMQWSPDRNAGFSAANPQQLYLPIIADPEYHYEAVNVEVEQRNPHSMVWWFKRLIALRKQVKAFGRGSIEFLNPDNRKVLSYIRSYEDERILVLANLSRYSQGAEIDLSEYKGYMPVEMFGGNEFPIIRKNHYFITLGPHSFYWFSLESERETIQLISEEVKLPLIHVDSSWEELFEEDAVKNLEKILPRHLMGRRWFVDKGHKIASVNSKETISIPVAASRCYLVLAEVAYRDAEAATYLLVFGHVEGLRAQEIRERHPQAMVAEVETSSGETGLLYDALIDEKFDRALLKTIGSRKRYKGRLGTIKPSRTQAFRQILGPGKIEPTTVKIPDVEQSNSSVVFDDRFIMKVLRKVEPGVHPDLEIGRFLTEKARFAHSPPVVGALEYTRDRRAPITLAILQGYVPSEGDAWTYTLDSLSRYYDDALTIKNRLSRLRLSRVSLTDLMEEKPPDLAMELFGSYMESARILGLRTAELHLALSSRAEIRDFAPEPFSPLYQRALYQSLRSQAAQGLGFLRKRVRSLAPGLRKDAQRVVELEPSIMKRLRSIMDRKLSGTRIRIHGDFHLGQVLHTGKDFIIIDFEGEPTRPLSERRLKRSPLRDVAGMLRSFHYAAYVSALDSRIRPEDASLVDSLARVWYTWISASYLGAYLNTAATGSILPKTKDDIQGLLDAFLLEKSIYEMVYELNSRPNWLRIPLRGILQLFVAD